MRWQTIRKNGVGIPLVYLAQLFSDNKLFTYALYGISK